MNAQAIIDLPIVGDYLLVQFCKTVASIPLTLVDSDTRRIIFAFYCETALEFSAGYSLSPYSAEWSRADRLLYVGHAFECSLDDETGVPDFEAYKPLYTALLTISLSKLLARFFKVHSDTGIQPDPLKQLLYTRLVSILDPVSPLIRLSGAIDDENFWDFHTIRAEYRYSILLLQQSYALMMTKFNSTLPPTATGLAPKIKFLKLSRVAPLIEGLDGYVSPNVAETQMGFGSSISEILGLTNLETVASRLNKSPKELGAELREILDSVPVFAVGNGISESLLKMSATLQSFGKSISDFFSAMISSAGILIPAFLSVVWNYIKVLPARVVTYITSIGLLVGSALGIDGLFGLMPTSLISEGMTAMTTFSDEGPDGPLGSIPGAHRAKKTPIFDYDDSNPNEYWVNGIRCTVPISHDEGYVQDEDEIIVENQAGFEAVSLGSMAIKRLIQFYVAGGLSFKAGFLTTLKNLPSAVRSVDELVKMFVELVVIVGNNIIPSFIFDALTGSYGTMEAKQWFGLVRDILDKRARSELVIDRHLPLALKELIASGENLLLKGKKNGIEALHPLVTTMIARLQKLNEEIQPLTQSMAHLRPRPVVLLLKGVSGSGKSNLAMQIAKELAYHEACSSSERRAAFIAQPRNEMFFQGPDHFNDGMTSQQCVFVHDDWYQTNPVRGQESPPGPTFIHMANDVPFTPRMAAVENKNAIFCNFKYMIFTSNLEKIMDETTLSVDAIGNRIDFVYDVTRSNQGKPSTVFDPDVYTLSQLKYRANSKGAFDATGESAKPAGVLRAIWKKAQENEEYYRSSLAIQYGETFGNWKEEQLLDRAARIVRELAERPESENEEEEDFNYPDISDDEIKGKGKDEPQFAFGADRILTAEMLDAWEPPFEDQVDLSNGSSSSMPLLLPSDASDFGNVVTQADTEENVRPGAGSARIAPLSAVEVADIVSEVLSEPPGSWPTVPPVPARPPPADNVFLDEAFDDGDYSPNDQKFVRAKLKEFGGQAMSPAPFIQFVRPGWMMANIDIPLHHPAYRARSYQAFVRELNSRPKDHKLIWNIKFGKAYPEGTFENLMLVLPSLAKLPNGRFFEFLDRPDTDIGNLASRIKIHFPEKILIDLRGYYLEGFEIAEKAFNSAAQFLDPLTAYFIHFHDYIISSPFIFSALMSLITGVFTMVGVTLGIRVASWFTPKPVSKAERKKKLTGSTQSDPQMHSSVRSRREKMNKTSRQTLKDLKNMRQAQSQGLFTDSVALVRKNLLEAWLQDTNGERHSGYCIALFGRVFLMPLHFITMVLDRALAIHDPKAAVIKLKKEGEEPIVFNCATEMEILYADETGETDILLMTPKTKCREFRDITAHLMPDDDVYKVVFTATRNFSGVFVKPTETHAISEGFGVASVYVKNVDEHRLNQLGYALPTVVGDCGLPLILTSGKNAGKIVGMHIAGNGKFGFSTPFSRSLIAKHTKKYTDVPANIETEVPDLLANPDPVAAQSLMDFHGSVETKYITRHMEPASGVHLKNSFVPFSGDGPEYFTRKTTASNISPKLFEFNRSLFGKNGPVKGDWSVVERLGLNVTRDLKKFAPHIDMRPYSFKEALCGNDFLGRMDTDTSPGYLDSAFGITRKMYWTFDNLANVKKGPQFEKLVTTVTNELSILASGGVPQWVMKDIEKGERLPIHKVEAGKVRFVNAPPVSMHVICRMAFGASMALIAHGAPRNGILKGIDEKKARHWNYVVKQLKTVGGGKWCGSGDYKGFDHSHRKEMIRIALKAQAGLYPPDPVWDLIRSGIIRWFDHQFHIFGSVIEQYDSGMPSGFPMTTETNCVIGHILFQYAFVKLNDFRIGSELEFPDHVSLMVLGDDNVFSVSEPYHVTFTEAWVSDSVADFGYVYTAPNKDPAREKLSPLVDHAILKRGFRFEPALGQWLGPLDLDVVLELPLWTRKGLDYDVIAMRNLDVALRELCLHGKEVFDHWVPKIRAFEGRYWNPVCDDWWTLLNIVAC